MGKGEKNKARTGFNRLVKRISPYVRILNGGEWPRDPVHDLSSPFSLVYFLFHMLFMILHHKRERAAASEYLLKHEKEDPVAFPVFTHYLIPLFLPRPFASHDDWGIGRTIVLAKKRVREEKVMWRSSLEGQVVMMLERKLDHEPLLFNGIAAEEGLPTGWRPPLSPNQEDYKDLYTGSWHRILMTTYELADYDRMIEKANL